MCFEGHLLMRAHIAKEDIICYKALFCRANGLYESPFYPYLYELNNINQRKILVKQSSTIFFSYEIHEGYHSCITQKNIIEQLVYRRSYGNVVGEFIIPKGTKYYKNKNTYVSETIILKKIVYESNS